MKHLPLWLLLFLANNTNGQTFFAERLSFGTNALQEARRIIRTPDNNFLVVGYVAADATSLNRDGLVVKINASGTIIWAKKYGGSKWEEFYDVVQVGNYYYCVGYTRTWVNGIYPFTGTPLPENVNADVFLVKLKLDGTVVWAKNMGKPSNGTGTTDGNDIGFRLVASGLGGVVISARVNSGASTNQNCGIIWVDADGKTRWAYRYDKTSNASNNELMYSIWKDGAEGYIVGGWIGTFGTPVLTGGILFKINQDGELLWDKNVRCSPGIFESLYYGFYNHKTGKVYTTDYYSQTSGTVREAQVCTNFASTGNTPASIKAKRYHYGAAGSSTNTFRALIFPVGDGYEQFILAANDINNPAANTTKYSTLIAVDENLGLQWAKKVGVVHSPGGLGFLNQIYDMVPCDGANQSLLAVGTVTKSNSNRDILIARMGGTGTLESCEVTASITGDTLAETATALGLTRLDLNLANCEASDTCWAGDNLISSITVTDITTSKSLSSSSCTYMRPESPEIANKPFGLDFIVPNIFGNPDPTGQINLTKLSFNFLKPPKEVYFEITDITGDFVYERFFGNLNKLNAGFDIASMLLPKGEYLWEIEAVYDNEEGIERKTEPFKVE